MRAQLLDALGLPPRARRELRTLPMEQLIEVSRAPAYLGPVKDGRSLPRDPFDPDAPPQSADIPMILGNTARRDAHADRPRRAVAVRPDLGDAAPELEANSPFMGTLDRAEVIATVPRWYPAATRRPTSSSRRPPTRARGADR